MDDRTRENECEREQRLTPIVDLWPDLRFLGMGAWWAWIFLCYGSVEIMSRFPESVRPSLVLLMYLLSTTGIAATMISAAIAWKRVTRSIENNAVILGFGIVAAVSTLVLGLSAHINGSFLFVIGALGSGVGTSALCLRAGCLYGSVSLSESLLAGGLSLVFAALLYFVGISILDTWRLLFIALLPVLSAVMLTMRSDEQYPAASLPETSSDNVNTSERRIYHRIIVASGVIAFSAGFAKGIACAGESVATFVIQGTIIIFFIGLIGALIVVLVNRQSIRRTARQVYTGLMVFGIIVLLATCFGFDIAYLNIGKEPLWMVLSCFLAYVSFRYDLSPIRTFGFGQAAYFLSSTAGWALGYLIYPYYEDPVVLMATSFVLILLVLLVLVYAFPEWIIKRITDAAQDVRPFESRYTQLLTQERASAELSNSETQIMSADLQSTSPEEPHEDITSSEPTGLARAALPVYGLSLRELEILDLFAQGRSANWIADSLTISKNTVRSHLRSIYTKLDVHTRQELLDFLAGKPSLRE